MAILALVPLPTRTGRRNTVDDLIVPLVEDGESPVAGRNAGQRELPLIIALGEREVRAIRASQAGIALGVTEGIAGPLP